MVNYRREYIKGGTYFFTVTLLDCKSKLLTQYASLFYQCLWKNKIEYQYKIIAHVIMPNHLHLIMKLHENDCRYDKRWRQIKSAFTLKIHETYDELQCNKRGRYNLWQHRFWCAVVDDENQLNNFIDYIHYNPVKHGYVTHTKDWRHSSFHGYVKRGLLADDWGNSDCFDIDYGE